MKFPLWPQVFLNTWKPSIVSDISRRELYCYIEKLTDLQMEENFSLKHNSFIFTNLKHLNIHFRFEVL